MANQIGVRDRYARGWHVLGVKEEFKNGEAKSFDYFGTHMVAFRG